MVARRRLERARIHPVLVALVCAAATGLTGAAEETVPIPKNVLVIVLDDLGTDKLDFYENVAPPYPVTPRLKNLADKGVRFTNFYVNPYCSTTRACLQTGRYAFRTGIGSVTATSNNSAALLSPKLADSEVFLPELLKHGFAPGALPLPYTCGAFGKWHMTYDYVVPGQELVANGNESHAVDNGYDRFYGMMSNVAMLDNGDHHFNWRKVEHDATGLRIVQEARWSGTVVREDAVAWINSRPGPFLAYVAFNPPHAPHQVPPKHLLSGDTQNQLLSYAEGQFSTNAVERDLFHRATIEAIDAEIDNLLDQIKQADLLRYQRTMVFVISDNGTPLGVIHSPHDPEHGKGTVYQIGVRVPMIVSGPPVPLGARGQVCDEPVGAIDLWRTIAAVTGADEMLAFAALATPRPPDMDEGKSFRPLILAPLTTGARILAFSQVFAPNGIPGAGYPCLVAHHRAVTDGVYKLIRKVEQPLCGGPISTSHELYNVFSNEAETIDLYDAFIPSPIQILLSSELDRLTP